MSGTEQRLHYIRQSVWSRIRATILSYALVQIDLPEFCRISVQSSLFPLNERYNDGFDPGPDYLARFHFFIYASMTGPAEGSEFSTMDGLQSAVLEFRSSTFFAPVLILYSNDIEMISQRLQEKIASAPDFFKNSPVLFDLSELNEAGRKIDTGALISLLRELNLLPVGIRGGDLSQEKQALELSVPIDSSRNRSSVILPEIQKKTDPVPQIPEAIRGTVHTPAMLITQPVRSGQRIYAASDLVILAQVSAGAEIMAEGNIHVYNTLRGRALAGVQGDTAARFFCLDLQAELVSIAGIYKTSEDLKGSPEKKPVQVYLQDQALIVEELD